MIASESAAEGSDTFDEKRSECARVLTEEYQRYSDRLREKLASLKKGSKEWWRLNRELLERKAKCSSIPPLRDGNEWIETSKGKANLIAKTLQEKAALPEEVIDCPYFGCPDMEMDRFMALRSRYTLKLLKSLDETKATGPDHIPASILKRIARFIAVPFTIICRRMLYEGCWPNVWRLHLICPLYKRKSAFMASNYRGVHLTAILSKVAEKLIGKDLIEFLQSGPFGEHQWAFTPGLSARDLVTALVCSWILAICKGYKIGGYLSDITGAFDRVFKDYLMAKLCNAGIGTLYLNFLDSYLRPRRAQVVVEGISSDEFEIANSVFQGTVLGPPLWNLFFSDVSEPAASLGGEPSVFADDLNVFQKFNKDVENQDISQRMHICRTRVHKWGRQNRVAFDPSKEHVVIIHPIYGSGDPFKLLGCQVDCKLLMQDAIDGILAKIRPKVTAILRMRSHYSTSELISQFKTHVWGIMETQNGGIFHASDYLLHRLDCKQRHFLEELQISEADAFLNHNFAPPCLRRDIGVLGLLHKRVIGKCHPVFQKLFPFHADVFGSLRPNEHDKQLYGHIIEVHYQHALHNRSIFGMVYVYNRLPQYVVDADNVCLFQRRLTVLARKACEDEEENWERLFSCRL